MGERWLELTTRGRSDRTESRKYLYKAEKFFETGRTALLEGQWNSAGSAAIHAGMSAADAATVASAGMRSSSKDHGASVGPPTRLVPESGTAQERQLKGLLNMKNTVEYEQRLVTQAEARSLVEQAGRLVRWAAGVVASHLD